MATPTLEEKLTQLQLMSAPAWLAAWGERHPEQRAAVRAALEVLVDHELARRRERAVAARIRAAKFVQVQTVDTFDFEYNGSTRKLRSRYLNLLATDLVAEGIGALFIGEPGLGKTHLARALGYAQCQRGHRVLFTPLAALVNRLSAAEATKSLHQALKTFRSPGVLIVDEVGYVALRQPESHLLFQVISLRHDRNKPTVITTNRPPSAWNQIFTDNAVAHAILDRLAERAEVFHLEGTSYLPVGRQVGKPIAAPRRRSPDRRLGSCAREFPRRARWRSRSPASSHRCADPSPLATFTLALVSLSAPKPGHFQRGASSRLGDESLSDHLLDVRKVEKSRTYDVSAGSGSRGVCDMNVGPGI